MTLNKFYKNLFVFIILNVCLLHKPQLEQQQQQRGGIHQLPLCGLSNIGEGGGGTGVGGFAAAAVVGEENNSTPKTTLEANNNNNNNSNNENRTETTITTTNTNAILNSPVSPPLVPRLSARPPAKVNKCCHFGEYLDKQQACVAGNSEHWVPQIYLLRNRTIYEPGRVPKSIQFVENVLPLRKIQENVTQTPYGGNGDKSGCSTIEELEFIMGSSSILLFSNGSLFLRETGQLVSPENFCVDREAALICSPRPPDSTKRAKIKKCCGRNVSYDAQGKSCVYTGVSSPRIPIDEARFQLINGFPQCREASTTYAIASEWNSDTQMTEDGQLMLNKKNISAAEYCLEHLIGDNTSYTSSATSSSSTTVKIFVCLHHFGAPNEPTITQAATSSPLDKLQIAVLNVGLVISVVFLGATLVASYLMPSVHHVLHWRCQIYYVCCLFVGDLLLAYTQLSRSLDLGSTSCTFLASVMHFFFLSAFFWLNTMCFNIWWTFRDFRPSSLERNQELLRLRLYSAYAWGIPLLITVIAAAVDQLHDSQLVSPEFGVRSCWFSGEHLSIFAYFFGPVGILLCANIILFVSTTHQLTCGLWKRDDVKSTTEKTALSKVCLKLVVVMGVTWIADIISWLVGGPNSVWFFTDLINTLQGVFIFVVVGCQPQVWAACKRFCCPRSRQEITNTTNGVQHSTSSQGLPSMGACGAEITQNTSINTTVLNHNSMTQSQTQQPKVPLETVC